MPKAKKTPSAKSSKPRRPVKSSSEPKDPEWAFLEERFSSLSVDFNKLAELMPESGEDDR